MDYVEKVLTTKNSYTYYFESELYTTNFAKRLDYALVLINDTDYFSRKLNVESLGEFLGLQSVNELKKHYITTEEPTYEFIEMVADKLGINPRWLKAGEGNVFKSQLNKLYCGMELFDDPAYKEIQEFSIAMLDVPYERYIILVRRMSEMKYEYYPRELVFYCSGGRTGASELLSVYKMLRKLNAEKKMPSEVYLLKPQKFYDLLEGKIYPGAIKKEESKNYLLDDFISLQISRNMQFENWYGKSFVDAQECVIRELKYEQGCALRRELIDP